MNDYNFNVHNTLLPVMAISGGMERTPLPTAFMFETGGYADFTFSNRNYDVTIICLLDEFYVW